MNKTEGNIDPNVGLVNSRLPWEDDDIKDDPKLQKRIANNLQVCDQMRVNTRLRNLMDLSPSKIKYKKLVEKYTHNIPTDKDKNKYFNQYLQDSHNKLSNNGNLYHDNVKK